MGNRIKAWNVVSRVIFILVFAASIGVFYLTKTGEGWTDFIINLIFAVIAGIFLIIYFAGSARPLAKVAAALDRVTDNSIHGSAETPKERWARFSQNPQLFGEDRLDERWGAYLRETQRLQRQNALTANCRISDYINEELLYSTVNKPFCDQLGGIMSGLGILFTFIGLVYGLRNFDATTVDVMQSSTQALMSGIKIAFLTSIFGLIYSLLFGISYKKLMKDSIDVLYDFQDAFDEGVRPINEHAAENAMIRLQTEQNAALQSFGTNIGDQVSEAIITLMKPTVDELQRTITQYVSVAIEDQRAGMEKVVRYFLDSMNNSLGNIFVQLKSRTEELGRWEKDMIDSITVMTAGVGKTTQSLATAQQNTVTIVETMASYTESIEKLTAKQQDVINEMRTLIGDYRVLHEQEQDYLRSISEASSTAAENAHESLRAVRSVSSIAEKLDAATADSAAEITAAGKLIAQSAENIRAMTATASADVSTAAARLSNAARDLDGSISRSVSDSLALLDESIAKLGDSMNGVTAASNNMNQTFRSLPRTVSTVESDIKATSKTIDAELKLLLKAVSDTQKSLNKFSADLERRADL